MNFKKLKRYLQVNLLEPGPCLMKKVFTWPRTHKIWETLLWKRLIINNELDVRF